MPDNMVGKIVVTNTTTERDVKLFRDSGVKYLMTTTPVIDGRSFGTNMIEAALLAASGYTSKVNYRDYQHYFGLVSELVNAAGLRPQLQVLN
jgi:hypothetical protein